MFDLETWNAAIEAAALVVEPNPHVEEERECKDVAVAVRRLKIYGRYLRGVVHCLLLTPRPP